MRTAAIFLLSACAAYSPGSFEYAGRHFRGQRATVGCLDIAVDRRGDLAEDLHGAPTAVLEYQFANRCDDPVVVDLARVVVRGRTVDGEDVTLTPYDPQLELRALRLDARRAGGEPIAYPTTATLAQICVDAASLGDHVGDSNWLCFASDRTTVESGLVRRPADPYEEVP